MKTNRDAFSENILLGSGKLGGIGGTPEISFPSLSRDNHKKGENDISRENGHKEFKMDLKRFTMFASNECSFANLKKEATKTNTI